MSRLDRRPLLRRLTALALAAWVTSGVAAASDEEMSPAWAALRRESILALSALSRSTPRPPGPVDVSAGSYDRPRLIVIGFTGGLEGRDSRVSGIVRMRKKIEAYVGDRPGVTALTYNNREWRPAIRDVLAMLGREPGREPAPNALSGGPLPLIIVYGHSWGAGAVTNFARALREEHLDVALAVYIDAFSLRNPRVPDNVHYAVNLYQRTGIFRGLPLRGKSKLILESPESTVLLANLRITPDTEHYGWHWNLVQPFLYRHHHRMSHDVRLQQYLLDLVAVQTGPPAGPTLATVDAAVDIDGDEEETAASDGPYPGIQDLFRLEPLY